MDIKRLEDLLRITILEDEEATYNARLSAAKAHINEQCGGRFLTDDGEGNVKIILPPDVELGAALLVKCMGEDSRLASQSLQGMSESYFQGGAYQAARAYWARYIRGQKVRFV